MEAWVGSGFASLLERAARRAVLARVTERCVWRRCGLRQACTAVRSCVWVGRRLRDSTNLSDARIGACSRGIAIMQPACSRRAPFTGERNESLSPCASGNACASPARVERRAGGRAGGPPIGYVKILFYFG